MNTELSILYIIFQIQVMIIVERTFSFYGFIIVSFIRFIESLTSSSILSLIALFSLSNWKNSNILSISITKISNTRFSKISLPPRSCTAILFCQ